MIYSPIRSPLSSAIRGVFEPSRGGAPAFDPVNVANASVYEPWNFASMFQDAAQTVPVTAVGQPVRVIRDRSSAALHMSASSDAARPLLAQDGLSRYYLNFPDATPLMQSSAAITGVQPALIAVLASFSAGISTSTPMFAQMYASATALFGVGRRPSIMAARAQVRIDAAGVSSVIINGGTNDIVVDDLRVHHADATSLLIRRGIDGADLYSAATAWDAQTMPSAAWRVGTVVDAPAKFYGGVFVYGAGAVSAKAEIISWLDQKKTV